MNSVLNKIGIKGSLQRNFGAIVILALTGSVIFGLPFFRFEYYDAYLSTYHLTNTQMGVFGTVIGVFGIISYLFGGVVADGMSVKKIIVFTNCNRYRWTFTFTATWIQRIACNLCVVGSFHNICILAGMCKSSTCAVR